jgi:hypothetical protein
MHRAFDAVCAKLHLSTGAGDQAIAGEKDGDKGGINACAARFTRCLGRTPVRDAADPQIKLAGRENGSRSST